ncbi:MULTISPECIES: hypothetical protein [Xanthomonas]|uniref:Uncharacterized protein n=2 Tax=Xanthomonas TaxID=338 RepID=A0A7Z7IYK2_XANCH|nr:MULTISPECIES: hypothetical protein [Xanthomonas]ATS39243.1 hypothetical protein XcfCFBP6988P_14870 [Xanthomonas citri pv. phaseoli var. fuscans]ATS41951.1 hypothetical protein XcfCFBP6989P_05625 [Xanthomonas citri pv. phaseoli var. fuscans]ATS47246.1 hypothetical protein XcfCFBP6990P_11740 [Xanthomonas citri pv. phaseoli var. fuscans]ATS86376.1 hypothetical protein XcfCFBP6991P_22495 [Xanthomonas citri pv. phaseoli var. fuscans]QWN20888.1 hypothetical protein DGM98_12805 [Xanthomonas citri]
MVAIPRPQAAIADRAGLPTREWYTYLLDLANSAGMTPDQLQRFEELVAAVDALQGQEGGRATIQGVGSIETVGLEIVQIYLVGDNDAPGASWYYGTGPDGVKGWYAIADSLAATADLTKAVDAGTGVATFGLADLPNSGVGTAIYKTTRDAKGRTSGQVAATTSDLPEGTNLYFTTERGQDATGAAITAGTFDGLTLTYDDTGNRINGANTDKGSTAVAAHVAQADPHPQYTTTAEASAAAPVQSVNGQTGNVSITPANIGAATAAQGAKADSALQDAPSDGTIYGRKNGGWTVVTGGSGAVTSVNARTGAVAVPDFVSKATAPTAADYGRALINGDRWRNLGNGVLYTQQDGAWLYDNAASLSRYVPAYLRSGASSPIPLNADGSVPAYLRNGTATSFPLQA